MQRIRSADLVSGHHVRIVTKLFPERVDLGGVVLGVAVGVRDELLGRGREACLQRATVAPIPEWWMTRTLGYVRASSSAICPVGSRLRR